jgi:hypothetical protein
MEIAVIHEEYAKLQVPPIRGLKKFMHLDGFLAKFPVHRMDLESLLLIVHGSNAELDNPVPSAWINAHPGEYLLPYIARRICQSGGRVMVVSGGKPAYAYDMRDRLSDAGFIQQHHFLTRIAPGDIDWSKVPKRLSTEWRVENLDRLAWRPREILVPLAILCQGYLAVITREASSSIAEVDDALKLLGWQEFIQKHDIDSLPTKEASDEVRSTSWWRIDGLDSFADKLLNVLHEEPWKSTEAAVLLTLIRQILDGQVVETIAVARGFKSLSLILERLKT